MGCYELTNYECASAPDFYRIATHTAALYIDRNLNVRRMKDDFSIPWKYFNFLTFTEIRQRALRDDQLSGKVTDLEEAHIGDRRPVLRMKLQEPGNRPVVLNLPEDIYNDINLENITTINNEVIVAATTLKVKPSPAGLQLVCTPATKVSVNPGLRIAKNMAKEFRAQRNGAPIQRLAVREVYKSYPDATTHATSIGSFYSDPHIAARQHRHIYTLAAVIVAISEAEPWFDGECIACPPGSRVQHTGVVFSCEKHGDKYVRYCYRAVCTVRDGTGTAIVTVLAPGINDIIGYDGCQMINVKECTDTRILPDPIRAIIGTEWAFMVKSFDRNLDGQLAFISDDVRPITVIMGRGQRANAGDGVLDPEGGTVISVFDDDFGQSRDSRIKQRLWIAPNRIHVTCAFYKKTAAGRICPTWMKVSQPLLRGATISLTYIASKRSIPGLGNGSNRFELPQLALITSENEPSGTELWVTTLDAEDVTTWFDNILETVKILKPYMVSAIISILFSLALLTMSTSSSSQDNILPMTAVLHMIPIKLSSNNYLLWKNQMLPLLSNQ
ncbi:hypothetical protein SSX86_022899 [Deinandra increscens subsp. villosa]|uniref:Uncharacterized protein n=1 Tax=Deinandra increscens subsp. villosa TaxID=3103831 RepID=A0AAP0CRM0_9ASTR